MDISQIKSELDHKGYVVVPDVLNREDVDKCLDWFGDWQKSIPDHDYQHDKLSPHGIYKFHQGPVIKDIHGILELVLRLERFSKDYGTRRIWWFHLTALVICQKI